MARAAVLVSHRSQRAFDSFRVPLDPAQARRKDDGKLRACRPAVDASLASKGGEYEACEIQDFGFHLRGHTVGRRCNVPIGKVNDGGLDDELADLPSPRTPLPLLTRLAY